MNILRRAPLKRLLAACVAVILVGAVAAIAAGAIGGPTPPAAPLAQAIHSALAAQPVEGVSAHVTFTDGLVPGAGARSSSPLLTGASGRVWVSSDGRARLELNSDNGDSEIIWDGTTLYYLDPSSSTLYEYTPQPSRDGGAGGSSSSSGTHAIPSVADIQHALDRIGAHSDLSGAIPDDVAGQPAYSVRLAPSPGRGGLFAGVQLWWDAVHGVPLRFAVYAAGQAAPVLELTADDVSYGAIDSSVFTLPTAAKTVVVGGANAAPGAPGGDSGPGGDTGPSGDTGPGGDGGPPVTGVAAVQAALPFTLSAPATLAGMSRDEVRLLQTKRPAALVTYGQGLGGLAVVERAAPANGAGLTGANSDVPLPAVSINGAQGTELATALGTVIAFQRDGVQYIVAGSVPAATALQAANGL